MTLKFNKSIYAEPSSYKVGILVTESSSERGGAERFYDGLLNGFLGLGFSAELIPVSAREPDFDTIVSNYDAVKALDLSDYDLVISTKVPTYAVRHPNHVLYLVHTVRVFDDMFGESFPCAHEELYKQRAILHRLDLDALLGVKARFAIGHEVANRLYKWRGISCDVLHPPLTTSKFKPGKVGDYFFIPGRLHKWKRLNLLIEAIKLSDLPMRLIIAGEGEDEEVLKNLANGDTRIEFVGKISDDELIKLYSNCLAVPFVPLREDYGYVTLEAFASAKPVLTCSDSGEPTYFVRQFETGLVVEPTPDKVREGMEWLWKNPEEASKMGVNCMAALDQMSWEDVAQKLYQSTVEGNNRSGQNCNKILVLDMQPIDPPIGGGRLRILGLYHHLGETFESTYVGTYDWPGESFRSHMLSESLREIDVPLSQEHHKAAAVLSSDAGNKVVIDLAFSQQAYLSPDYIDTVRESISNASVISFSHPWVFPLVKNYLRKDQVVIYDSHNVEGYLRAQLLDKNSPAESSLLRRVVQDENDVGDRADLILTCSHEDLLRFNRLYGFPPEKMRVVPNGVFAFKGNLLSSEDNKKNARKTLKIETAAFVAIFIGSPYGPNIQAGEFISNSLAAHLPEVLFVIAGGVGEHINATAKNVFITGGLSEDEKCLWLSAADIALNPMMAGSGTNIKMFDFMGASLPVITTATGARGVDGGGCDVMVVVEPTVTAFRDAINRLKSEALRAAIGSAARKCVEDGYSWERISNQLGCLMESRIRLAGQSKPLFSVVIPTYERHNHLELLIQKIQNQIERDFEVIVVDQSKSKWSGAEKSYGFPLTYYYSPVKGAVRARNTGALLSQGQILAFIDDDCIPEQDWLLKSKAYFMEPDVVGVEGLIYSDRLDDPNWRPVTNVGFEGIGFMTANLFVRSNIFQFLGGFDLQFDNPHFREDTDFGWRLLKCGSVPYANDVCVFHPSQSRDIERESREERAKFFQKDALLFKKHPELYEKLFFTECHYVHTPGFKENLLKGFLRANLELPSFIESALR